MVSKSQVNKAADIYLDPNSDATSERKAFEII
jgi:hypothetical protein